MKIVLPGEKPISWNKFYAGMHWGRRAAEKDRVRAIVRVALGSDFVKSDKPVKIVITSFSPRPLDPDNITSKLYIDAVKGLLIVDDTCDYVASVTTASRRCSKAEERVEIEILTT